MYLKMTLKKVGGRLVDPDFIYSMRLTTESETQVILSVTKSDTKTWTHPKVFLFYDSVRIK